MTEDFNLLIRIAQLAGVFVGFGALISVLDSRNANRSQLTQIRAVVSIGLIVIVASLLPIGLGRYGVTGQDLWRVCGLVFLVLVWAVTILSLRMTEGRQLALTRVQSNPLGTAFFWIALEIPLQVPLILTVIGSHAHLAPAFYITALILHIFEAAFVFAQFVYSQQSQIVSG